MLDKLLLQRLLKEFEILKKENIELRKRVKELEEKLSKYENPKNSGNSSIPPSQDPNRTTKSLRKKSDFPKGLVQRAQYGDKIKALCVYLQNYQMLPFARCCEFIEDLTGHHLSQGSLSNFKSTCYDNLENYESSIKKLLLQSEVLHADEKGVRLMVNKTGYTF